MKLPFAKILREEELTVGAKAANLIFKMRSRVSDVQHAILSRHRGSSTAKSATVAYQYTTIIALGWALVWVNVIISGSIYTPGLLSCMPFSLWE